MSAIKEHYHDEIEKGQREALNENQKQDPPEMLDDDSDSDDDEIFGYECLGCGHVQDHPGECEKCMGSAVDPMYF